MSKTFQCTIITPEASVFDGEVSYARFPAWDGQYGMLPGLAPLLSSLAPGGLRLDLPGGKSDWYLVEGGFAHVDGERLTILGEAVTPAEELDISASEAQLAELVAEVPGTPDGTFHSNLNDDLHDFLYQSGWVGDVKPKIKGT